VSGYFIGDKIKKWDHEGSTTKIYSSNLTGLQKNSFIHIEETGHTTDYYNNGEKFEVLSMDLKEKTFIIKGVADPDSTKKLKWCLAKDDVTPQDIFRLTNEGPDERAIIAKYCIQDCNLVHHLLNKIDVVTSFVEMSKLCSVPMNFLVMRGQGIKLTSYVAKKCREKDTLLPVIDKGNPNDNYEGAIVLPPKCGLYVDNPVACVDYSSLYPSSMISENLSHDSKVWTKEYDLNGILIKTTGERNRNDEFIYDNLPEYEYVNVEYDTFRYFRKSPSSAAEKVKSGTKICRFAQFPNGKAIMPSILEELLHARKSTRKMIANQKDEFMKNVLDKRQLSYKITANSLYGQCGAKTSTFYDVDVAASCTSTGRKLLTYGKRVIEEVYADTICDTKNHGQVRSKAEYIYGDTDSVFFTFNLEELNGDKIVGKKALELTIELAQEAGELATKFLKGPHDLEYEKTFDPLILLSKKRYVGMLYETDINVCSRKSMGIVLKRRDNAPIVKDVYGGIIDIIMKDKSIEKSVGFLQDCLSNLVKEKYPLEKLIITKSLRGFYKNPKQIAHKVLADRIGKRDPGNKPNSGDRIPYVYIVTKDKVKLQGDKIETPDYIRANNIRPNYGFYITNQIMKPILQLFGLVIEEIPQFKKRLLTLKKYKKEVEELKKNNSSEDFDKKVETLRNKKVKEILFDKYINEIEKTEKGNKDIKKYFI